MLTAVENNDTKWEYTYDVRGNILIKKEYTVSTADDGTKPYTLKENETSSFGYDTVWADKLTSFNGQTIAYDDVGNPLTYRGNTLTWNFGRRLASFGNITYTYNEDGIRNLNPFRYRGYYYDTDTSLYYLQSRYYDPETGRFLNSDDVNFIGTTESEISYNPFAYCENDPVNAIDPTGRSWYSMVTNVFSLICTFAFLGSRLSWKARVVISMILGAAGFLSTIIDYRKQLNQIKGKRNYSRNLKEANLWLWLGIIASCITVISGILYIPKFALSKSVGVAVINAIGFARGMGLTNALLANDLAAALNRTPRPKFRF